MDNVLETHDLVKCYGQCKALDQLSMTIPKGAIYGFVGKNGAGKTTMLKMLCGLQRPIDGTFTLYGVPDADRGMIAMRKRLGAMVEAPAVYRDMTAEENMRQQYRILGRKSFEGIDETLHMVGLEDTGNKKVKHFSQGMRQKLGLAMVLTGEPDFIILDEPLNGLDPQGIIDLRHLILRLNREKNITFLISSHILVELSRLATHYGFIDHGHMLGELTAAELDGLCHRKIGMKITNRQGFEKVMQRLQIEYDPQTDTQVTLTTTASITSLAIALKEEDCEILTCWREDEDLETFFLSAIEHPGIFANVKKGGEADA